MNIKLIIFLSGGIILSISVVVLIFIMNTTQSPVIPGLGPTPTPVTVNPLPTVPFEMRTEKVLQENYAKERAAILDEKPWLLQLPLKSNNYFISYDTEKNEFVASIYYFSNIPISNDDQIAQAKKDVFDAIKSLKLNPEKEKIVFIETQN